MQSSLISACLRGAYWLLSLQRQQLKSMPVYTVQVMGCEARVHEDLPPVPVSWIVRESCLGV